MKKLALSLSAFALITACSPQSDADAGDQQIAADNITLPPAQVVESHMKAFEQNDMDAIVADYSDDVIFILPDEVRQGRQAVYDFFEPQRTVENPPALTYEIMPTEGSVVVAPWTLGAGTPGEMTGRDIFIVEEGKITSQVVYIQSVPS